MCQIAEGIFDDGYYIKYGDLVDEIKAQCYAHFYDLFEKMSEKEFHKMALETADWVQNDGA